LSAEAPETEGETSYDYDPMDPALTGIDVRLYPVEDVPLDQSANEARQDVICFTGTPVTREIVLSGCPPRVFRLDRRRRHGLARQDHRRRSVGVSRRVTQGCLRAACRTSLEQPSA